MARRTTRTETTAPGTWQDRLRAHLDYEVPARRFAHPGITRDRIGLYRVDGVGPMDRLMAAAHLRDRHLMDEATITRKLGYADAKANATYGTA